MNYLLSSFSFAVVKLFETFDYEKLEVLRDTLIEAVNVIYKDTLEYRKGHNE